MGENERQESCRLFEDEKGEFPALDRLNFQQKTERTDQLIGDLIRYIAKTHVKVSNSEYQMVQLEIILARVESESKALRAQNESLIQRLSELEQAAIPQTIRRKQSFFMEGGSLHFRSQHTLL
ncbi:hypothetical protein SAMN05443252_102277 [Bacillus sp. OV322]|uniref:hypothetical protein n=1 Tax=Bacillus sp. OV322 TaxID=1882764 RepID=UPI0008F3015A|nr:hypothetical protein [Bacillus sp. OV322]SFC22519.1 hypothetical protein SAMN05443252_102277 [Bacillus sp. OV322]